MSGESETVVKEHLPAGFVCGHSVEIWQHKDALLRWRQNIPETQRDSCNLLLLVLSLTQSPRHAPDEAKCSFNQTDCKELAHVNSPPPKRCICTLTDQA